MTEQKGFFQKLQDKWGVSAKRVVLILIVFALTGTTILFLKTPILNFIVGESEKTWVHSLIYFILILPLYNLFLLMYGSIFGQFSFFWEYEKKFFRRMAFWKKKGESNPKTEDGSIPQT